MDNYAVAKINMRTMENMTRVFADISTDSLEEYMRSGIAYFEREAEKRGKTLNVAKAKRLLMKDHFDYEHWKLMVSLTPEQRANREAGIAKHIKDYNDNTEYYNALRRNAKTIII
jgi:hypothetical protein